MDYFCFIQSVVAFIENRVKGAVSLYDLEEVTCFSLPHVRFVFKQCTNLSLGRYILCRRVWNAAFEVVHTKRSLLDIAFDYGFESYDTFTRAFRRITEKTPSTFREKRCRVGRIKLLPGLYGPGSLHRENLELEEKHMREMKRSEDSCILYGVPKVQYSTEEMTPFPSVLKSCLHYMGQDIDYCHVMAASGAAFRLRWNTAFWDGGNVDITYIYEDYYHAFERSFRAVGRKHKILKRSTEGVTKEDFINFLIPELTAGRPVIALGIIGPPEACIITGYKDHGETLLGWNFFQDNPGFAKNLEFDPSGYFVCKDWWENPHTDALLSIGEEEEGTLLLRDILENAHYVLTTPKVRLCAGGQDAFDAWAHALGDTREFPKDAPLPLLFERLMCQMDAMCMIGEGRREAARFLQDLASTTPSLSPLALETAGYFEKEARTAYLMAKVLGGWQMGEIPARNLADAATRSALISLIQEAKAYEDKARLGIEDLLKKL